VGLLGLLGVAGTAPAAEAPTVYVSPTGDGQPPPSPPAKIPLVGANDLDLWIASGPTATPAGGAQIVCANALGDELCGWQLEITATGGVTIQSFTPATVATGQPIRSHRVSSSLLRVNRVHAAQPDPGDFGPMRIGTLSVFVADEGEIRLGTDSEVIGARLQRLGALGSPLAVPEPATLSGIAAGILFLALALRGRSRTRRSMSLLVLLLVLAHSPARAQIYIDDDGTAFRNAVGNANLESEDFESWLPGGIFAAIENDFDFGAFTFRSTALPTSANLIFTSDFAFVPVPEDDCISGICQFVSSGLNGTALLLDHSFYSSRSIVLAPGGSGLSIEPQFADDDLEIVFHTPKRAAGLLIQQNDQRPPGETIQFLDENDVVIAGVELPQGSRFVGFVSLPPSAPIKKIVIDESAVDSAFWDPIERDDITLDDVTWADQVALPEAPTWAPIPRLQKWQRISADHPKFASLQPGDNFGLGLANLGDLNGDAVVDVAIGAPRDSVDGDRRGALWITFLQRARRTLANPDPELIRSVRKISDSEGGLSGPGNPGGLLADGARFGFTAAALGNLDGDPEGTTDIAVGSPEIEAGTPGSVYILFMRPNGEVADVQRINRDEGIQGGGGLGSLLQDGEWFGDGMSVLGDLDRDGRIELAVGARNSTDGGGDASGAVFILSLNPNGTAELMRKIGNDEPTLAQVVGLNPGDRFGSAVEGIGDIDRDGVPDMAVGALTRDASASGDDRGAVYVLFLNEDGTVKGGTTLDPPPALGPFANLFWGSNDGSWYGSGLGWIPTPKAAMPGVLAIGLPTWESIDPQSLAFNGEGAVELFGLDETGAPFGGGDIFRVNPGPGRFGAGQFAPTLGTETGFGARMTSIGDLDLDGSPEILVGARRATVDGKTGVGAAYLVSLGGLDASAFGDAIAASSGRTSGLSNILGTPTGNTGAALYQGASVTVQFTNNVGRTDGTLGGADLRISRPNGLSASQSNTITIGVSADGVSFQTTPDLVIGKDLEQVDIDLDQYFFGGFDEIRFVRLTIVVGCDPPPDTPFPSAYCESFGGGSDPRYHGIELLHNASLLDDFDFDGVVDGVDNCRYFPNPLQGDLDGDGFGDYCDVCPELSNPDQAVVCAENTLDLEYLGIDGSVVPNRHEWDLTYVCGSGTSTGVGGGFVVPIGIDSATAEIGGGVNPGPPLAPGATCGNPIGNPGPPGDPGLQVGCLLADPARIGEPFTVIDPGESGVLFPSQALLLGGLPDTLYFDFQAFDQTNGWCEEPDQEVFLGRISTEVGSVTSPTAQLTNIQTSVVGVPDLPDAFRAGPTNPDLDLVLTPAVGEPDGAATRYEVCFRSDQTLNRLTFAVVADPDDDTVGEIGLVGCDDLATTSPVPTRTCSGVVAASVDAASSRVWGPFQIGQTDSILVFQVEGDIPVGLPPINVLNPSPTDLVCVGTIQTTTSSAQGQPSPDLPPDELVGWGDLWNPAPLRVLSAGTLVEVSADSVDWLTTSLTNAPDDLDGDAVRDESDNCRFRYNPPQENSGGLLSEDPADGPLGDTCECGDLNFSGRLFPSEPGGSDLDIMRDVILGLVTDPDAISRCSVSEGTECTMLDAVLLDAALGGNPGVGLSAACADAIPPVVSGP
jgi:hypothetical protein